MNFVAQVEEHLRDLGTEARRKHPGVKEASERAILQLRSLQTTYVSLVRQSSSHHSHPTTSIFQSQDILRPFLLAANYPDVNYSLLNLVFNAFVILISGDAVCKDDGVYVVRVLSIQANVCCSAFRSLKNSTASTSTTTNSSSSTTGSHHGTGYGNQSSNTNRNHNKNDTHQHHHSDASLNYNSGGGGGGGTISSIGSSIMSGFGILGTYNNNNNHNHNHNNNHSDNQDETSTKSSSIIGGLSSFGGYSSSTGKTGRSLKEDEALSIRILQLVTMIVNSNSSSSTGFQLTEEILTQCLAICFTFINATSTNTTHGYNSITSHGMDLSTNHNHMTMMMGGGDYDKHKKNNLLDSASNMSSSGDKGNSLNASAKKVKRAAIATLRQIISIVFDRAATEMKEVQSLKISLLHSSNNESSNNNDNTVEENDSTATTSSDNNNNNNNNIPNKSIRLMASRLFLDLCHLAEYKNNQSLHQNNNYEIQHNYGPFTQALVGNGIFFGRHHSSNPNKFMMNIPPSSVCFDLLEMIISQQVTLFTTKLDHNHENSCKNDFGSDNPDFASLLRNRLCPVLSNMLTSEFVIGLDRTDNDDSMMINAMNIKNKKSSNRNRHSSSANSSQRLMAGDNPASFALLMTLTKLAATIITVFGTHSESLLDSECHVLIMSLVKYVKAATELIRDSHEFEDGFVYSNSSKQEIQQYINSSVSHRKAMPYASSHVLWRAAITLELLYSLISDNFDKLIHLFESRNGDRPCDTLLSVLIEAVTDFSVVVSSNQIGIISVIGASATARKSRQMHEGDDVVNKTNSVPLKNYVFEMKNIEPMITSRARDIVKSQDEWNDYNASRLHNELFPDCDLGAAAWVGFNFVLGAWKALYHLPNQSVDKKIFIEGSFASSLSLIQHFLRRFPASDIICKDALAGYSYVSKTILPTCNESDLKRRLLLTSLCKMSLPSDEKLNQSYDILDHHVAALCLLVQIIHSNSDMIMDDWSIILCTIESFNKLSLSYMQLSDDCSDALSTVALVFSNVGSFTSCLSEESIIFFLDSLITMSKSARRMFGYAATNPSNEVLRDEDQDIDSFRRRIMSYAEHALNMGTNDEVTETNEFIGSNTKDNNLISRAFRSNLRKKLSKISTRDDFFSELPFTLILLADVVVENCYRYRVFDQKVSTYLSCLAAATDHNAIRVFSFDVMTFLICQSLGSGSMDNDKFERLASSSHFGVENSFKVEIDSTKVVDVSMSLSKMPQEELLTPLCQSIIASTKREGAEIGLQKLKGILELGHNMSGAWLTIIHSLTALSGQTNITPINRTTSEWSLCCTNAFGCLRLIVDDFLDSNEDKTNSIRTALLDCCASFGRSQHDVNISLTATGMMWTIADQDDSPESVDHVLANLASLASDNRVEVRNCSLNTLYSCIAGCGHRFSESQWRQCIMEIILSGILDTVDAHSDVNQVKSYDNESDIDDKITPSRYRVSRHHTRDSTSKQWTTSKVLILQGIERVLRIFFEVILEISVQPSKQDDAPIWFEAAFKRIVILAYNYSIQEGGREVLDLRTAGVDLLSLCCQASSTIGVVAGDVRVGTNMQVVNGALRSVRNPHKNTSSPNASDKRMHSPSIDSTRSKLFEFSFSFVTQYNAYLTNNESMRKANDSFPSSLDNTVLQVLTKLCQGLSHIYECCKDNELLHLTKTENTNEVKFVELVSTVTRIASAPGSKYLTQVQRICFDLFEKMSLNSSLLAYKALARLFYCIEKSSRDEALQDEASKILNKICSKKTSDANITVLKMILQDFVAHTSTVDAARMMMIAPFMKASLCATKESNNLISVDTGDLWINMIKFLESLFTIDTKGKFQSPCNSLLEILSCCYDCLPEVMYDEMGKVLSQIANDSVVVAQKASEAEEENDVVPSSLRIFQKSFSGICTFANLESIQSVTRVYLDRASSGITNTSISTRQKSKDNIDIEVATLACETLSSMNSSLANEVALELFPSLCKLMNTQNINLRRGSSKLMSKVDIRSLMTRVKTAEDQIQNEIELPMIKDRLQKEVSRADNAEQEVQELRLINSQLMKQVEQLRSEKERLEQQVAVFTEGSAYI